jgi:hypothetical protein
MMCVTETQGGIPYLSRERNVSAPAVHVQALDLTHVQ